MKSLSSFIGQPLRSVQSLAWFGFSADPPTLSHRMIVDAVLGSGLVDMVVVFPAGKLSYKDFQASDWQRTDMVELWKSAAEFGDEVIISRFDMLREKAMNWYQLWEMLQERSGKTQHFLIVGSDQYSEIPRSWARGKDLLRKASFIIVPRKGYAVTPLNSQHILLPIDPLPGSSTDARNRDFSGVDGRVKAYILEQGLYL